MLIDIPFGKSFQKLDLSDSYEIEVLESAAYNERPKEDGVQIVKKALENPVESPKLSELSRGKKSAVIICSDHTRPVPSKIIIPLMLEEIRRFNPDINVTLLIATGFHRESAKEELISKFGAEIVENEKIVIHNCADNVNLKYVGLLPSGAELVVNKLALECDLLVSEGFIEPHFFAGYSGGRKSVLPGICGKKTVLGNHCSAFIDNKYTRTGVLLNNPIHEDMIAAARMVGLKFILNVVINSQKEITAAFAGDFNQAHKKGCDYLDLLSKVSPKKKAEVVITSNGGYPLDQNIYQSVKSMTAAEAAVSEGGVIITCSACNDGTGSEDFYKDLKDCESPAKLMESIFKVPMEETVPDQWETQVLARVLMKHHVIVVANEEVKDYVNDMKMEYVRDVNEAFEKAVNRLGNVRNVTVIPDGVSVIVRMKNED